ncbi:MAG TPA: nucleoside hydrolase [Spirochaetota bacterium]|nr:nucleoside hydrolase [Spirochaetota bacterium]HOR44939.1 nucleoside hydrolase [Spirochaetota bacterium]HPK56953.1 nucleoside hydrolase [Spirochaetota bacterium]
MKSIQYSAKPRMRVILCNDFGGDPDGMIQLAHHILSPSVEIRAIIGSFFTKDTLFGVDSSADAACSAVRSLLKEMNLSSKFNLLKGSDEPMKDTRTPVMSEGAEFIVKEAMRNDSDLPLFILCGASLTDLASACLINPEITSRLTAVWIGGAEYYETAGKISVCPKLEYNMGIDIVSAQYVFNYSKIPLWQVPRDVYRQVMVSYSEIQLRIKKAGKFGKYLAGLIDEIMILADSCGLKMGETYIMGDSPLVLLSALQSAFDPDTSSSAYIETPAPQIDNDGNYILNPEGRKIRVYQSIDVRLLMEDFYCKLQMYCR